MYNYLGSVVRENKGVKIDNYNIHNVETYYFTQLKMCYLMTTFRCPSDILIILILIFIADLNIRKYSGIFHIFSIRNMRILDL